MPRRSTLLVLPSLLLALAVLPSLTSIQAAAQAGPAATLTLVSQSIWNGPKRPLDIRIKATNVGPDALEEISLVVTIQARIQARSIYDLSLETDATPEIAATPFGQPGILQPEESRIMHARVPLAGLSLAGDNALYPVRVQLLSQETVIATLRTPMVFLVDQPAVPLNLTWTWVLAASVQFGPDGVFLPGDLEEAISPTGRLGAMVGALDLPSPRPLDLVVSPSLVDQLQRMARGYRIREQGGTLRLVRRGTAGAAEAAALLARLAKLASQPATELSTMPYGDPSLPALLAAGLGKDIRPLAERGRALVGSALGAEPRADVAYPPQSMVDQATLTRLALRRVATLLLEPGIVTTPVTNQAASPIVRLPAGDGDLPAIAPDEGVSAIAGSVAYRQDPRLAAQAALGELAAIWLERPGTPGRGAAVLFSDRSSVSPPFFVAFSSLVRGSPWLNLQSATRLVRMTTEERIQELAPRPHPLLLPAYVNDLRATRLDLKRFRTTIQGGRDLTSRLQSNLFLAEGGTFVSDPALGRRFISSVTGVIDGTYRSVRVPPQVFTLASQRGTLPVTITNGSGYPMRVLVRLIADRRLTFVDGNSRRILLSPKSQTISFAVSSRTTGRFPVKVQVQTSAAVPVPDIAETQIVVRSTAYNRVALVLTIGAALFLLVWWGRRFFPRRRS